MSALAAPAALAVALAWVSLAYWLRLHPVGDDVAARLDALTPSYDFRYLPAARQSQERDYSGDRGQYPQDRPRYPTLYDEIVARLGLDPLSGRTT